MMTNDLKKGARVLLNYGTIHDKLVDCGTWENYVLLRNIKGEDYFRPWEAVIEDNQLGDIRLCLVHGFSDELGSVYAYKIIACWNSASACWERIQHTPSQLKMARSDGTNPDIF